MSFKDLEKRKLSSLGVLSRGRSRHRPRYDPILYDGKYPFIQTGDIRNAGKVIKNFEQTYNDIGLAQSKLWPKGTLCITIAANIAETAILGFDACFPDSVVGFIPDESKISIDYAYYFLQYLKNDIQRKAYGSAQENINIKVLESLEIYLPTVEVQGKITDLLTKLDEKIELNNTINNGLEEMAQALFKHWFVDFEYPNENGKPYKSSGGEFEESELGLIPRGWELIEMGSILSQKNERVGDRKISEYSTTNTGIKLRDEKFKKSLSKNVSKNKVVEKHDIVFGMSREVLNFGVMRDSVGAVSPAYHVFKVDQGIYNAELLEVNMRVRADLFLDLIRPGAREGQGIDQQYLKRKKIIVPTKQIQDKYYEIYSNLVTKVEDNNKQNSLLSTIRDTLLPKLISGEARIQSI